MKITRNKQSSKKTVYILIAAAVLVLALLTAGLVWGIGGQFGQTSETQSNNEEQSDADKKANSNNPNTTVDPTLNTDQIPTTETFSISLDSLVNENDMVTYKASVTGASSGTCSASFTSDLGKPVVKTSETTDGTCSGSYSVNEFDALGLWTLQLRFYANDLQATTTGEVNVN